MEKVPEFVRCGYLHCCNGVIFSNEILPNFRERGPRVCEVRNFCRSGMVFSEEIVLTLVREVPKFMREGFLEFEALALVTCLCCNGVVLSTEEIRSNFGEGGGPRVCGVWLLSFAAMHELVF